MSPIRIGFTTPDSCFGASPYLGLMEAFPPCSVIFRNQVSELGLALREFLLLSGGESTQPPGQFDWVRKKVKPGQLKSIFSSKVESVPLQRRHSY